MARGQLYIRQCGRVWEMLASLLCDKYWDVVYPYRDSLSYGYCSWLGLAWYLGGTLLDNGFRWLFLRYRYQRYMSLKG